MVYSLTQDNKLQDKEPELPLTQDPELEIPVTSKWRQECILIVKTTFWVGLFLFLYAGLPLMAGGCSVFSLAICQVTGDQITYKDTHYQSSALIGLTEIICYVSDNHLSGNHLRISSSQVVFDVCGHFSIPTGIIWALTIVGLFLFFMWELITWLSTSQIYRTTKRLFNCEFVYETV